MTQKLIEAGNHRHAVAQHLAPEGFVEFASGRKYCAQPPARNTNTAEHMSEQNSASR